ncbi:MAG TPA: dTDP-4-dehydrorhamnose 3,5-epimerase [Longimicrobiaceae bacterium]|nr:dTDP-4-dehydrorhamnose 3,5-epimerase [Longimicrobiaceae bacterium]
MQVGPTEMPDVLRVEPRVFRDGRGQFHETWSAERYGAAGIPGPFVQDNVSLSRRGVVRGLHFQHPHAQGKLVWVPRGHVLDVVVDVRVGSPTFGRWAGFELSDGNALQLFVPPGFAHGFQVLSDEALFAYKCTDVYHPECERTVRWDDPAIGVRWPLADAVLSPKDAEAPPLHAISQGDLPRWSPA